MKVGFVAIILFVYLVTRGQSAVIKGKIGEFKVANQLRKYLPSPGYRVFNDLTVHSNNGTTQINHVVISPFGIFVIEKSEDTHVFGFKVIIKLWVS